MHVNDVKLCPKRAGASQESGLKNIHVAYPTSRAFSRLEYSLSGRREQFQRDLTQHLLRGGYADSKRTSGEVVTGDYSINIHVNFGYRRIQKHTNPQTWYIGEHKMPTLSVDGFKQIPAPIQQQLVEVFDCAQKYTERKCPNCFPNDNRTRLFARRLNRKICFPHLSSKFEYFHLVLSRNTTLRKHIDTCNDD